MPTIGRNFPNHRGLAIGIMKSMVGLSGAIASQFYQGLFGPGSSKHSAEHPNDDFVPYLLFIGVQVGTVCLVGFFFLRQTPPLRESPESLKRTGKTLQLLLVAILCLATLIGVAAIVESKLPADANATHTKAFGQDSTERKGLLVAVYAIFFSTIFWAVSRRDDSSTAVDSGEKELLIQGDDQPDAPGGGAGVRQYSLSQAVRTLEFWCIFTCFFLAGGSGILIINNLANINLNLQPMDASPAVVNNDKVVFVTLISVLNCFGRLLAGALGDYLLKNRQIPRPIVFALACGMMCFVHALLALAPSLTTLYVVCIVGGMAYGAFNSLCPTLISEIFGTCPLPAAVAPALTAVRRPEELCDDLRHQLARPWLWKLPHWHAAGRVGLRQPQLHREPDWPRLLSTLVHPLCMRLWAVRRDQPAPDDANQEAVHGDVPALLSLCRLPTHRVADPLNAHPPTTPRVSRSRPTACACWPWPWPSSRVGPGRRRHPGS